MTNNRFALILFLLGLGLIFASSHPAYAQGGASGLAWLDSNLNGQIDEGEARLSGVLVWGQDEAGQELETTTAEDGSWSLGPFNGQRILIRFELPADGPMAGYRPSQAGWNTVQAVNLADKSEGINAGFYDPSGFCAANPELVLTRFVVGDSQSADGINGGRARDFSSLLSFPYSVSGDPNAESGFIAPNDLLQNHETGAIWGLAWDEANKKLYSSAFVKRHAGLGPLGLGGIYVTDMSVGKSTSAFIDLTAAGVDVGEAADREIPADVAAPSVDAWGFENVGKAGIGGIDVSLDGQRVYAMNLGGRELVTIDAESGEVSSQIPMPDLGCTNGIARPFAVKVAADGNLFAGAVCTAEDGGEAADLSAHILQLDGDRFSTLFSFPLADFKRGTLTGGFTSGAWNPWTDEWNSAEAYPVPILSDIEFDDDGSIIVALMDRTGHMVGLQQPSPTDATTLHNRGAGGDVIRICQVDGSYVLEGDPSCPHNRQADNSGHEFYVGEQFEPNFETSMGGIALAPNTGEVAVTVASPFAYFANGVRWLDNATGESRRGYQASAGNFHFFGGANGLGDIEVICQNPPVEIGSRVWRDANDNGVLDAGEPLLPNVQIELYDVDRGLSLATVLTDANGRFGFSSGFGTSDGAFARSLTIQKDTNYQLRTVITQGVLAGLEAVKPLDSSDTATNWQIDSDAILANQYFAIDFEIAADDNKLSHLDFGFKLEPDAVVAEGGGTDPLQPASNTAGSNVAQSAETEAPAEAGFPDELYGIPIDPSNRLFWVVAGLFGGGIIAVLVGFFGLSGTFIAIRRHRRRGD